MTEWTWAEAAVLGLQVTMGVSLAACAGLRAFLPLLVLGSAGRLGWVPLSDSFSWLASTAALVVFATAVVTELLADKIPFLDHVLDTLQTVVKPVAGTVIAAGLLTDLTPLQSIVVGTLAGGIPAGVVHLFKAKARLISTAATAGLGNPLLSIVEDAGAFAGSVVAVFLPLLAFAMLLGFVVLFALALRRLRRGGAVHTAPSP